MESDSPRKTRKRKRTAPVNLEGATSKNKKITFSVSLYSESEYRPRRSPRVKPLAES